MAARYEISAQAVRGARSTAVELPQGYGLLPFTSHVLWREGEVCLGPVTTEFTATGWQKPERLLDDCRVHVRAEVSQRGNRIGGPLTECFDPALEAIGPDEPVHDPREHCRSLSVRQVSEAAFVAEIVGEESERVAYEVLIGHDSQPGIGLIFDLLAFSLTGCLGDRFFSLRPAAGQVGTSPDGPCVAVRAPDSLPVLAQMWHGLP